MPVINFSPNATLTIEYREQYSSHSDLAAHITEQLKEYLESCGDCEFKFKGKKRGPRRGGADGGAKKAKKAAPPLDPEDFNPVDADDETWHFNGFNTYLQSVRVCDKEGDSIKEFRTFADAQAAAVAVFEEWDALRQTEPNHPIFKFKKWSVDVPPVGGVIRNKKTYAVRKPSKLSNAPPCALKKGEGKASWSLKKSIAINQDGEITMGKKKAKAKKTKAITVSRSPSPARRPAPAPRRTPTPEPEPELSCETCKNTIIRDSVEHDHAKVSEDGEKVYCKDCPLPEPEEDIDVMTVDFSELEKSTALSMEKQLDNLNTSDGEEASASDDGSDAEAEESCDFEVQEWTFDDDEESKYYNRKFYVGKEVEEDKWQLFDIKTVEKWQEDEDAEGTEPPQWGWRINNEDSLYSVEKIE
jgi:hypothetical protein